MSEFKGLALPHLSASTINSFIEYRHQFFASKVEKLPFVTNVNMARGKAVEHGINVMLNGRDEQTAQTGALNVWQKEIKGIGLDPRTVEFQATLAEGVRTGGEYYRKVDERAPTQQQKIEITLDGCKLPIIGYLDYLYNEFVRDCKITGKTPSKLRQSYIIQGAIYKKAMDLPVWFDFGIPLKGGWKWKPIPLTDEEYEFGLSYAIAAAKNIEALQNSIDPSEVMELCLAFPNLDAIWDDKEKDRQCERYGIKRV